MVGGLGGGWWWGSVEHARHVWGNSCPPNPARPPQPRPLAADSWSPHRLPHYQVMMGDRFKTGWNDTDMIDFHIKAVQHQLRQLRIALQLAVVLNRTIVMPKVGRLLLGSWLLAGWSGLGWEEVSQWRRSKSSSLPHPA